MNLIIYHSGCPDGFCAAYIAKLKYPEAKLLPRDHGLEPPYDEVTGKDVLVVDFSWRTREQNDKLASLAKSFKILDHHKSALEVLAGADYAVFDMKRSGAGLAWDYLFGKDSDLPERQLGWAGVSKGMLRPWWVSYVEDRDLWNHALAETEAVNAYIMTTPYEIEAWKRMTQVDLTDVITSGKAIRLEIDKYIREVTKQTQVGSLITTDRTYSVGVVNVPYLHTSDIGNVLAKSYDIGMGWFERRDGMMQFSLRSIGDIDVSKVAQSFNGGGHRNAAGFQLPLDKGRAIVDTILGRS
jgi:nanoRNase/pAp phosphatase (c-di-AMP/oligoRNAs hydrolase)